MAENLYVFIDESGNYDFSPSGTRYLVLTCLSTSNPETALGSVHRLKHSILDLGVDLEYFHASEDAPATRELMFDLISEVDDIRVDSVVVEKRKTHPALQDLDAFYPKMVKILLGYVFHPSGEDAGRFDMIHIFMDRAYSTRGRREALKKAVKKSIRSHLQGTRHAVYMHSSASHSLLQIVDYCSWAIFRKWEREDPRGHTEVRHAIESEFPVFRLGKETWY